MSYVRYSRKTQVSWQSGPSGALTAERAYRVEDLTVYTPEVIEAIAAEAMLGQYYPSETVAGGRYAEIGFSVELRGRHTPDAPPPEGPLWRAASFNELGSASPPNKIFAYQLGDPHSISGSPAGCLEPVSALGFNFDRRAYTIKNAVATEFEVDFVAGKLPMCRFKFRGQPGSVSAHQAGYTEAAPSATFEPGNRAVPCQNEVLTLTGYSGTPRVLQATFKLNPEVDDREDLNSTLGGYGVPIMTSYDPRLILRLEEDLRSVHDPFSQFVTGGQIAVSWSHNPGGALGQKFAASFTGKLVGSPKITPVKGKLVAEIELSQATAGALPLFAWS